MRGGGKCDVRRSEWERNGMEEKGMEGKLMEWKGMEVKQTVNADKFAFYPQCLCKL